MTERTALELAKASLNDTGYGPINSPYNKYRVQEAQAYALIAIAEVLERMYKWDRA